MKKLFNYIAGTVFWVIYTCILIPNAGLDYMRYMFYESIGGFVLCFFLMPIILGIFMGLNKPFCEYEIIVHISDIVVILSFIISYFILKNNLNVYETLAEFLKFGVALEFMVYCVARLATKIVRDR